jgi:hypothetical protein
MRVPNSFIAAAWLVLGLAAIAGCDTTERGPKTDLTDAQKQELIELDQQRKDEWGNTVK